MKKTLLSLTGALALALAGCPDDKPSPKVDAGPAEPNPGVYVKPAPPADAPPKTACAVDTDCEITPMIPSKDDACCNTTVNHLSVSAKYLRTMHAWQSKECGRAKCPGLLIGKEKVDDCVVIPKCWSGVCGNFCGAPIDGGTSPMAAPQDAGSGDGGASKDAGRR